MSKSISIAVVIPLHNKVETIRRALQSVDRQNREPDELIIVDDGSTDGSLFELNECVKSLSLSIETTIISQSNRGVSVARNVGANESISDYICFLDADDEWLPGYLEEIERLARTFPEAGVLTLRSCKLDKSGCLLPEPTGLPDNFFGIVANFLSVYRTGYGIIHSSSLAIRRDAWERSGKFPVGAKKSQDIFLWLNLGLTEVFAHSAKEYSIWHDDSQGLALRHGVVPYHLAYFLGTDKGRAFLENVEIRKFLEYNILAHVGGHYYRRDTKVVNELMYLSKYLGVKTRMSCLLLTLIPRELVLFFSKVRRWIRRGAVEN